MNHWEDPIAWAGRQMMAVERQLGDELQHAETPLGTRELDAVTFIRKVALGEIGSRDIRRRAREVMDSWYGRRPPR